MPSTHGSTGGIEEKEDLVASLMAELTGRYEDLAALTIAQHRPGALDAGLIDDIIDQTQDALQIARAARSMHASYSSDLA